MRSNVLVIAAHPDDEVLGCGGTIARHARNGDRVDIFIAAEGVTARDAGRDALARAPQIAKLHVASQKAAATLGAREPSFGGFPDNRMDSISLLDVVKSIESLIARLKPAIVYTHHGGDLNVDHQVLHRAAVTACRPLPGSSVAQLLFFEVLSSTEWQVPGHQPTFTPNHFVDISGTIAAKQAALRQYRAEMRPWPHARSLRSVEFLARHRGSTVGVAAAEAFVLGRSVVR